MGMPYFKLIRFDACFKAKPKDLNRQGLGPLTLALKNSAILEQHIFDSVLY